MLQGMYCSACLGAAGRLDRPWEERTLLEPLFLLVRTDFLNLAGFAFDFTLSTPHSDSDLAPVFRAKRDILS